MREYRYDPKDMSHFKQRLQQDQQQDFFFQNVNEGLGSVGSSNPNQSGYGGNESRSFISVIPKDPASAMLAANHNTSG